MMKLFACAALAIASSPSPETDVASSSVGGGGAAAAAGGVPSAGKPAVAQEARAQAPTVVTATPKAVGTLKLKEASATTGGGAPPKPTATKAKAKATTAATTTTTAATTTTIATTTAQKIPSKGAPYFTPPTGDVYTYTAGSKCAYGSNGNAQCCGAASRVVIDGSVVKIAPSAFASCHSVATVDFSGATQLKLIGARAFDGAGSITALDLSGATALATIEAYAFIGCDSLAAVTLGSGVVKIGSSAFANTRMKTYCAVEWGGVDCVAATKGSERPFEFKCSALPCGVGDEL